MTNAIARKTATRILSFMVQLSSERVTRSDGFGVRAAAVLGMDLCGVRRIRMNGHRMKQKEENEEGGEWED